MADDETAVAEVLAAHDAGCLTCDAPWFHATHLAPLLTKTREEAVEAALGPVEALAGHDGKHDPESTEVTP